MHAPVAHWLTLSLSERFAVQQQHAPDAHWSTFSPSAHWSTLSPSEEICSATTCMHLSLIV